MIRKTHPSHIVYACLLGIICGITMFFLLGQAPFSGIAWIIVAVAALLLTIKLSYAIMIVMGFCSGLFFGSCRISPELASLDFFRTHSGETVILSGTLSESPDTSSGGMSIRLKDLHVYTNHDDQEGISLSGSAYVKLSRSADLERSDTIVLKGKLGNGFGTFATSLFRSTVLSIERPSPGDIFVSFKNAFTSRVKDLIPSPAVDLGLGYLMGLKSGLSESFSDMLQTVGMTHVVVASGAHLAILVNAAKKIFGRLSKFAGTLGALLMIMAFAMIVGFTPSMTRAALVATLSLLVSFVGRKFTPLRLIILVAALTLLIEPTNFLSLGWQLSFASFFGLLVIAPRLQKSLYGGKAPPWLASMLITSLATSLACAPILIYNFGSLSLLSFVANLIVLPTLPYVMFAMLLTGIASFIPFIATFIATITSFLLNLHIGVYTFLSEKTMFIIEFSEKNWYVFLLYFPLCLFLIHPFLKSSLRKPRRSPNSASSSAPDPLLKPVAYKEDNML